MWMTLCHDQLIRWAKAKVHVYSESNIKWKEQVRYFQQSNEYAELSGIDIDWNSQNSEGFERSTNKSMSLCNDVIHVAVQRRCLDNDWLMYVPRMPAKWLRQRISARALVIPWSWRWRKVVWNMQLQARRKMGPASPSNDWSNRTKESSRIPMHKCAQPRNIQAKTRTKHCSLHSGRRKHCVNNAHHSLITSAQYLRSSVELVYRPFWKNARSRIHWSDEMNVITMAAAHPCKIKRRT